MERSETSEETMNMSCTLRKLRAFHRRRFTEGDDFLVPLLVTTSKALVTTSDALVTNVALVSTCFLLVRPLLLAWHLFLHGFVASSFVSPHTFNSKASTLSMLLCTANDVFSVKLE